MNPPNETKESWLKANGKLIGPPKASEFDFTGNDWPVCLVDNGMFTAAAIAFNNEELQVFLQEDGRPKVWLLVSREKLVPYCEYAAKKE